MKQLPLATWWDAPFLAGLLLAAAAAGSLADRRGSPPTGLEIRTRAGVRRVSLRPQVLRIKGSLGECILEIQASGSVRFIEAPCPHKLCIRLAPARHAGDAVVCVPGQVLAELTGPRQGGLDGITQ